MKPLIKTLILLFSTSLYAHHTRDHMMLSEDAAQIIATTQQGTQGNEFWILWTMVFIILLLGFTRWWKNRK